METATWIAVIILGPGSLGIFIWFLTDLRSIMHPAPLQRKRRRFRH